MENHDPPLAAPPLYQMQILTYLKMVLELESFEARRAFKLAQIGTVSVICHVSLQLGQVGKLFGAHSARLN